MPFLNLGLAKENIYKQFVPKGQFYEYGEFNQAEKNIFINCIKRISLYSQLTRENTNIDKYKDDERTYEEISIFLVELKEKESMDKIAKLILSSIPYPMILIGKHEKEYIFYGAHQKDNKLDSTKIILEKIYSTGFIDRDSNFIERINYKNLRKVNFHELYSDYIEAIITFNLEQRNIIGVSNKEEVLEKIENLEEERALLKNKMKSEKQFNKKMDLNIKIKKIENELRKMGE